MRFAKFFGERPFSANYFLIFPGLVSLLFLSGCNDHPTDKNDDLLPQGSLSGHSECKSNDPARQSDYEVDEECIVFSYDGRDTLFLTHVNTAFNCCPDSIMGDVSIDGNNISISETESFGSSGGCNCLCLFDLEYVITGLAPGIYKLKIDAPYYLEDDAPLEFDLDLTAQTIVPGQKCLTRNHYPWEAVTEQPINILRISQCGGFEPTNDYWPSPPILDTNPECIVYDYDGEGMLTVFHEGIYFNCCLAGMSVRTEISGNDLYIYEEEVLENGGCDCICDYDMEYGVSDLTLSYYNVKISGGNHYQPLFPPLFEFMLVTTSPVSDTICVIQ